MITLSMPSTHYMVFTPNLSVSRFFFTDQCKWPLSTHSCVRFLYFPDRLLVTVSFFLSQTGIISILFPLFFVDGTLFFGKSRFGQNYLPRHLSVTDFNSLSVSHLCWVSFHCQTCRDLSKFSTRWQKKV